MDDFKYDNILTEQPRNTIEFSKLPRTMKLGEKVIYSMIENTEIILPKTGNITYRQNNVIKYDISLQGQHLRFYVGPASYHSCKVTFIDTTLLDVGRGRFDSISNSVFKKWLFTGANELEDIDQSHVLTNLLLDCLVNPYDRSNYYSFFGASSAIGTTKSYFNNRDGYMFIDAEAQYFCQLIPSGLFGMGQSRLVPLSAVPQGIKLSITCETNQLALVAENAAGVASYELSECQLNVAYIELSELLSRAVEELYRNTYIIPFETYHHWGTSLAAGHRMATLNIPCDYKYVKGILGVFRSDTIVGSYTSRSLSCRAKAQLIEYQFRLGTQSFPSNSVVYLDTDAELQGSGYHGGNVARAAAAGGLLKKMDTRGMRELMKVFNNQAHPGASCSFSAAEFNSSGMIVSTREPATDVIVDVDDSLGVGAFAVGCNFSPSIEEDIYRMTVNPSGQNIQFKYVFNANLADALIVDFWLLMEADAIIELGTMRVAF